MPEPGDYGQYTVGWICAIYTEYVAARVFLDEEHGQPQVLAPNDTNCYTLGRIGKHKVVISALPDGEYGVGSAANVATNLIRTFKNVRIGFMVGIGGGIPSPPDHDIRLGDVVVGHPGGGHPGVFHYDFGKPVQSKGFQYTSCMNLPPKAVRTVITQIRMDYEMHGNSIQTSIDEALDKVPRLRSRYKKPDPRRDVLFVSSAVHDETCCQGRSEEDKSRVISRPARTDETDNPAIHYGLILSGNQVVKDANVRDWMAREHNALCVEMEAAGLVNTFPCLIIRGICDYADSHKNDEWQRYAAMAAAAFAKDVIARIPVSTIDEEKAIFATLSSVDENLKHVKAVNDATAATVQVIHQTGVKRELQQWLQPPDISSNHATISSQRMSDSGLWLIHNEKFNEWRSRQNSFLLLCGIAGCGKSFLTSAIIDSLQQAVNGHILYFYFDFQDGSKQSVEKMLRSLIYQAAGKEDAARKDLEAFYSEHSNGTTQPTIHQLCARFKGMIEKFDELWIIIDALDECDTRQSYQMGGILDWLKDLVISPPTNVHVLATSRRDGEIEIQIAKWAGEEAVFFIQNDSALGDVRRYVQDMVRKHPWFERWHAQPGVQYEIESRLMERADGLFLLVARHMERLKDCLNYPMLQEALASIPTTICDTYTQILRDIPSHFHSTAVRLLQLLTYSQRPLEVQEVVDALSIDLNAVPQFRPENRMPMPEEIPRLCQSLVCITSRTKMFDWHKEIIELRLAHSSVKEYIQSKDLDASFAPFLEHTLAQTAIASVCVAYLSHFDHKLPELEIDASFPFAQYSAEYWIAHASNGNQDDEILHSVAMNFLLSKKGPYFDQATDGYWVEKSAVIPALYHAAAGGLARITKSLLDRGVDINQQGGKYGNALQVASVKGDTQIVRILLANKANVNAFHGTHGYALHAAALYGHAEIVQLLLDMKVDPNAQDALHAAVRGGHEHIVRLLLEIQNLEVDSPAAEWYSKFEDTPLYLACKSGSDVIVRMLLDHGAAVNAPSGYYSYPLIVATHNRHKSVVEMLLDSGADTEIEHSDEGTPLHIACKLRYTEIVGVLLDHGANINATDEYGTVGTPFQVAFGEGHTDTIKLLISRQADLNGSVGIYGNALCRALSQGDMELARLLLDNGARANVEVEGDDMTPLGNACFNEREEMMQLLLDNGADINGVDSEMRTALHFACSKPNARLVDFLLHKGADATTPGQSDYSVLQAACKGGDENIVQLILGIYSSVDSPSSLYDQALITACSGTNKSIVQTLIDHGANPNALASYSTPLITASRHGRKTIVRLLLKNKADPNYSDGHETPLTACKKGCYEITRLLMKSGADANIGLPRDERTALETAVTNGNAEIIRGLLKNGADVKSLMGALIAASIAGKSKFVKILLAHGAAKNMDSNCLALFEASAGGHETIVRMLLDNGASPNSNKVVPSLSGHKIEISALYAASKAGRTTVVGLLLEKGADLNAIHGEYGTALFVAAAEDRVSVIKVLLNYKADPNIESPTGWEFEGHRYPSALYAACAKSNQEVVNLLLDHGASPHQVYEGYGNALFAASAKGDYTIVETLLALGADFTVPGLASGRMKGKKEANSLYVASENGYIVIVELLLNKGADLDAEGGHYGTALQAACAKGREGIMIILLDGGAEINAQSGYYGNALQAALGEGYARLAKILLGRGAFIDPSGTGYQNALSCPGLIHNPEAHEILRDESNFVVKGQKRRVSQI